MLNGVFRKLLEMSAKGSIVILAVLAVRFLLRRAPRKAVFVLWAAVLLRLLCPLTLHSPVGLLPEREFIPAAAVTGTPTPAAVTPAPLPTVTSVPVHSESAAPATDFSGAEPVPMPTVTDAPKAEKHISWKEALPYLWLSGCVLLLGYSIGSGLRLRYRLRESVETETGVRVADGLESAFVMGFFRPCVYLPSDLPEGARPYILEHERAHIRRGDTLWKRLGWLALCLHWFNPLVWLAFFLASRDMEMACDERVLGGSAGDIRADYSELLLRLSTGKHFLAAPLAFGEGDTGSRIRHILKWKKPRTWLMVGAALICIAAAVFCVLERSGKETVWEREVPEFRTTIRVQWDGKKYSVNHTRIEKLPDGATAEPIRFERPVEDTDGIYLTGVRNYYDAAQNRMTHDALTLYLLTPENIKELRDAEWEQAGIRIEVRVLDGEALLILAIQQMGVNSNHVDVREIGQKLASGEYPEETTPPEEITPPEETTPPENIDLSVPEGYRALTAEELRTANDHLSIPFSDWSRKQDLTGAVHAFHICHYDDPRELDLQEFLSYLFYGSEELQAGEDEEEFQLWRARGGKGFAAAESIADMPVPVHRYPREKVNEVLMEYAGITVDDLILPYWEMSYYLPETDAFYNITSDFAMGTFRCEAGETDGETVRLYTDASRHSCAVLTLRKSGEKWMIAARQMTDENGNILSAVLAGEWQYRLSAKYMQELFDNRETLPLDDLIRFLLKADGAYAEGGAAEIYERFLRDPVTLLRYLLTWGESTVPEHPGKTAAQAICEMLAAEAAWFDSERALDGEIEQCFAAFPDGRGRALTEYLWSGYRKIMFSQSNHLSSLAGAGRTDEADGLALYHDGWDKAVTLQDLGEYPWGYPFTAQDVSFHHSDGSNTYRAVCTDGTVLSGFNWDRAELLDIASLTDIYTENPAFATPNGIRVGMKRSEVPGAGSGDIFIAAQKDALQLVVHFDGDTVSALELVQGMDAAVY